MNESEKVCKHKNLLILTESKNEIPVLINKYLNYTTVIHNKKINIKNRTKQLRIYINLISLKCRSKMIKDNYFYKGKKNHRMPRPGTSCPRPW